jgi:peptidyl-prolyl cis-trans isomerase A (cyclophilin A)
MNKILILAVFSILCLHSCNFESQKAKIYTKEGTIELTFFSKKASLTTNNFKINCRNKIYDGACFYRVVHLKNQDFNKVKIEVVQGGLFYDSLINNFPFIPHENTAMTGLKHKRGSISMARNEPGTASTEFFICINDQPELDYGGKRNPDGQGFAIFGKVTAGMEIVKKIHKMDETDQYLSKKVIIDSIRLY